MDGGVGGPPWPWPSARSADGPSGACRGPVLSGGESSSSRQRDRNGASVVRPPARAIGQDKDKGPVVGSVARAAHVALGPESIFWYLGVDSAPMMPCPSLFLYIARPSGTSASLPSNRNYCTPEVGIPIRLPVALPPSSRLHVSVRRSYTKLDPPACQPLTRPPRLGWMFPYQDCDSSLSR